MDAAIPHSLDDLAALLDRARLPQDVFGADVPRRYRRFAKLCHPDLFATSPEKEKAHQVFLRLTRWLDLAEAAAALRTIVSPLRRYTLVKQLAAGDLADIHLASAGGHEFILKITRPIAGNPLLVAEARRLKALAGHSGDRRYREYIPRLVESFALPGADGSRQVNVFAHRPGFFTLEDIRRRYSAGLDARHLAWVFKRLLAVLGFAHACDLIHAAVLPPHVMIHAENHGLQLLDWIHAVPIGGTLDFVPAAYRDWYPPEALDREAAGPATDIYLAAKCLIYLAGGDPVAERWPESVPESMRRFIATCLYPAPRMRPQDAWKLHEEFDELLERLFGAPKYHRLVMA
jgi:hypothetical protein